MESGPLLEGQGQLGGMGTSGLVSHWLGGRTNGCRHWVVGGIFRELATEAQERGISLLPAPAPGQGYSPFGWNGEKGGQLTAGVPFEPFAMTALLEEKMVAEGVELLYFTRVVDVIASQGRISHVGAFPELEDQMVLFTAYGIEGDGAADRVDALVWAITELFPRIVRRDDTQEWEYKEFGSMQGGGWMA